MNMWRLSNSIYFCMLSLLLCMLTLLLLLSREYSLLQKQVHKIVALKKEYKHHVALLKQTAYVQLYKQIGCTKPLCEVPHERSYDVASEIHSIFTPIGKARYYLNQVNIAYLYAHADMQAHCFLDGDSAFSISQREPSLEQYATIIEMHKPFIWPIEKAKFWLSSVFGMRKEPNGKHRFHYGIDLAAAKKTQVTTAAAGIIDQAYEDPLGYGKTIVIKHDETYKTRYAHLDSILVKSGQQVHAGMLIGRVGDTGNVRKKGRDASHLHFEVYELGKRVNPLYFLS